MNVRLQIDFLRKCLEDGPRGGSATVTISRQSAVELVDFLEKLLRAAELQAAVDEILKGH